MNIKPSRWLAILILTAGAARADETRFREAFADPETRAEALSMLVPGSREAYFHTALDHQHRGRRDEFLEVLAAWKQAAERERDPVPDAGMQQLEFRQALLDYDRDPEPGREELIRQFGLRFEERRPDAVADAEALPTAVDPALLSLEAFEAAIPEPLREQAYLRFAGERKLLELEAYRDFDRAKLQWFLENSDRPDHPSIVPMVARAMDFPENPVRFGDLELHGQLNHGQLRELLQLRPALRSNSAFASAWLATLLPGAEVDFARDPAAHAAHLQQSRDFVVTLPDSQNALKAHVLFHHLRLQRELGNHPKDDFLLYLRLPRLTHPWLRPADPATLAEGARWSADVDFSAATRCGPVGDDSSLVEAYLEHFLRASDDSSDFAPLVLEERLARLHARARLMAGADPGRWAAVIGVEAYRALVDERRIDFAPGRPVTLDADEAVALDLDLKHTPELRVRVYEIDLPSHLAQHGTEPDVTLDLEGLVPHRERTLDFDQAPVVRHRQTIELPELEGAGAWLVEFVSGPVAARALVRKGLLTPVVRRDAEAQEIRVFDERERPVTGATLELGAESHVADESGRIRVPNQAGQPRTRGILRAGRLAVPLELGPRGDELRLDASFLLDREQLLAEAETTLHLRLRLSNHGHELPLDLLENPTLTLRATLAGGASAERVLAADFEPAASLAIPFQVPADLRELRLVLGATVRPPTGGDPLALAAERAYTLNGDLASPRVADVHFASEEGGHRLELRGRNGEPLPSRELSLGFRHRELRETVVSLRVRSDADGTVALGPLEGIESVTVAGGGLEARSWQPPQRQLEWPSSLHVLHRREILLPLDPPAETIDPRRFSLLEQVGGRPVRSHFERLELADDGRLSVRDLPAGEHLLRDGLGGATLRIQVSGGEIIDDLLVGPARILPLHLPARPWIREARVADGDLLVNVLGAGEGSRVTVIGRRFHHPDWSAGDGARPFARPLPPGLQAGFRPNGFLTERRLDDETAYILARRAARALPGAMLPRPGLLLHRWSAESLAQSDAEGAGGRGGRGAPPPAPAAMPMGGEDRRRDEGGPAGGGVAVDFLARPSVVAFDLELPEDGVLRLPVERFAGSQHLEILVAGEHAADRFQLALPAEPTPTRERRLARPFDPGQPLVATRRAAALEAGAEAVIENLLEADWRAFTTLEEAHQLLFALVPDSRVRDFVFLTLWPDLDEDTRLVLLERHASHELHLFLARRDPEFFDRHVRPMLEERPAPDVIDELLLGRDLSRHLSPHGWSLLNWAEKALVARAVPEARERIAREMELEWEFLAPPPQVETVRFTQTLRGSSLAALDSLGLARRELQNAALDMPAAEIARRLSEAVIPEFEIGNIPLADALLRFHQAVAEVDPELGKLAPPSLGAPSFGGETVDGVLVRELQLQDVSAFDLLRYLTETVDRRFVIEDSRVLVTWMSDTGDFAHGRADWDDSPFSDGMDPFGDVPPYTAARLPGSIEPRPGQSLGYSDGSPAVGRSAVDAFEIQPAAEAMKLGMPQEAAEDFPEHTRVWQESRYLKVGGSPGPQFINPNRFWVDLALWDGEGPFLSPHFNACTSHANEALLCLALLDLPFSAERPETVVEDGRLRVKAREPMLLFYKDTRAPDGVDEESPLLVRQSFHPHGEPFRTENNQQVENAVEGDFQPGVAYGASLVITNPTGIGRRVEVLAQIPAGSIPLADRPATLSEEHELPPYGVLRLELAFYFPDAGDFTVYPLHVAEENRVLARSAPRNLRVVDAPAVEDSASWEVLARDGSAEQVLERLRTESFRRMRLDAIRWRLQEREFYEQVTAILRERLHHSRDVAMHGFLHGDPEGMRDFLIGGNERSWVGPWFESGLLSLRPDDFGWMWLDFDPLVNPRAHAFGDAPRLGHEPARKFRDELLDQLAWKPALEAGDHLRLCLLLLLEDRLGEALERFDRIDPEALSERLPYDYLHAVVLFHRADSAAASEIADGWLERLPPATWRGRFATVSRQAAEIAALGDADEAAPADPARPAARPALDLATAPEGGLVLSHRGVGEAEIMVHGIDLEVLFSKDPFLRGEAAGGGAPPIRPNARWTLDLDPDTEETRIELPEDFRRGNVLVTARAGGRQALVRVDSRALDLQLRPGLRELAVSARDGGSPLAAAYVKVYAEYHDGSVRFHKDGYTDLRGRFDYLSHTGVDLAGVRRVAIFVDHPDHGARTLIQER